MPKQVDHEQRRRMITEALCRLASTSGLEGVSLGQVAAEAGVSKGLVQHYFHSKDQMLLYATGYLRERVERRITELVDSADSDPRARLRAILAALLPTDDASRTQALVANAFFIRALTDPVLASLFRRGNALLRGAIAMQIRASQRDVAPLLDLDPVREADILLALVGGLGNALLLRQQTPAAAMAILDDQLDRGVIAPHHSASLLK
ncbi:TetR/AcrR family transcriptional regulator [Streptomyces sp. NPDC051320]|uniref:TetR/AcrR family transcriptional regulator n=1 Tax=Streptomyces sp. NPDC051320 TaxID=3154644 RepID=UPI00342C038D